MSEASEMSCYWCDWKAKARFQRVTVDVEVGQGVVRIHNVPAYVCEKCAEHYYDIDVVGRMFAIHRKYEDRQLLQGEIIKCDYDGEEVSEDDGA